MEQNGNNTSGDNKDAMYVAGGVALLVLGAGLIMTHPSIRRAVGAAVSGLLPEIQGKFGPDLTALGPDIQRYLKLRSM